MPSLFKHNPSSFHRLRHSISEISPTDSTKDKHNEGLDFIAKKRYSTQNFDPETPWDPVEKDQTRSNVSCSSGSSVSSSKLTLQIPRETCIKTLNPVKVSSNTSTTEVERLRVAMTTQLRLSQQREMMIRQNDGYEKQRSEKTLDDRIITCTSPTNKVGPSPSFDEPFGSPELSGLDTASTESTAKSFKAGNITPRSASIQTPSYPFPQVQNFDSYSNHKPFANLSTTAKSSNDSTSPIRFNLQDTIMSNNVTPDSEIAFQPVEAPKCKDDSMFETPNLYDLSLMLSSEPGLEPWWANLVDILKNMYGAQRATLSVPADSTDIENVPWGQKATFNMIRDDESNTKKLPHRSNISLSGTCLNENSNFENTSVKEVSGIPLLTNNRPKLPSRNSFPTYEDTKRCSKTNLEAHEALDSRPSIMPRTKSHFTGHTDAPPRTRTLENARLNLKSLEDRLVSETSEYSSPRVFHEPMNRVAAGRVFSVLQALDHESDPLIDNKGISRVIQRGNVIALTRDYPYIGSSTMNERTTKKKSCRSSRTRCSGSEKSKTRNADLGSRTSSNFFGYRPSKTNRTGSHFQASDSNTNFNESIRVENDDKEELDNKYDEYEQASASPWSQSPAPSPAIHLETSENLFFPDMQAVEETFNPQESPLDYCEVLQPEMIGADRSWTVLHIPLLHPLLSKPVQSFRLDAAALESRSAGISRGRISKDVEDDKQPLSLEKKPGKTPIAILSILTPLIPYPSNLRNSLANLAPHLATTFSLCRHHSNLETEINGLSRKRPTTNGFGAVAPGALRHYTEDYLNLGHKYFSSFHYGAQQRCHGGCLTSPSEYSGLSKSNTCSPIDTPSCESRIPGILQDKRLGAGSPGSFLAEGYFSSKVRSGQGKLEIGSVNKAMNLSKDPSQVDVKSQQVARDTEEGSSNFDTTNYHLEQPKKEPANYDPFKPDEQEIPLRTAREVNNNILDAGDQTPCRHQTNDTVGPKKPNLRTTPHPAQAKVERSIPTHTLLHSYGADFGLTFQSLPATSRGRTSAKSRAYSCSGPAIDSYSNYMPPPSDRVKGILLDSLPLHLFIAMPPTGEVVWVNSRYLTYRGQSLDELHENPWSSIHPVEREEYLKSWKHSLRTGEQFAMQARLKRFDGIYRWFYTRISGLRDSRGVVVQWHGTSMDIHEQHVAEVKAARQEEVEASEAKHRRLANLIPQIIFSASDADGITFANQQWLSYTGQTLEDSIGLGFIDFVHPEDLAKCHVLIKESPLLSQFGARKFVKSQISSPLESHGKSRARSLDLGTSDIIAQNLKNDEYKPLSRTNSSCSTSFRDYPSIDIVELTRSGVVKTERDSNGQLSYSTEVRLRSKSGEYRWHLVRCVEIDDVSLYSSTGSWFGACADINDQKLLEMKLKEAMESKSRFLSNMSHEIRTPLIGISGMIGFMQETELNEEQIDYCNTISSSAQGLLAIINDILDLAKADAGMIKLAYSWFHIRSLVEEVNETLSTMAITKHLEVNYVIDFDVPDMVKGDRFRIRQALLNVIGNAIKFTTIGEVFTRCKIAPGRDHDYKIGENEVKLEFSITDTGKGFTQEEAEIIFKPFSQIDASSTRSQGGTGLGLVISRQLVELHGGKMEGTAIPGKGSTFTFTVVCGLPTPNDSPSSPTMPKLNSPPYTPSNSSFERSMPPNKKEIQSIERDGDRSLCEKKQVHSPTEDSFKSCSSIGSFNSFLSDSLASSVHSEKSLKSNRLLNQNDPQTSLDIVRNVKARISNSSTLKLDIPFHHPVTSATKGLSIEKNLSNPNLTSTARERYDSSNERKHTHQPLFLILLICPQIHSREATTQHIEMTLSTDVPHKITALASVEEAYGMIGGLNPTYFTHIVLNLGSPDEIINLIDHIIRLSPKTSIVILSDPLQRQKIMTKSVNHDYAQLAKDNHITFIFKPVKPSRFAIIFDPEKERDLSTDRNRSSAEQQVATQRQNYLDIGKRLGNKGLKVLLVEDNATNQKVLMKYLTKVGIAVELALDGVECTEKVFKNPHNYYSLILVCFSSSF